jgi:hypothetical protein
MSNLGVMDDVEAPSDRIDVDQFVLAAVDLLKAQRK